MECVMDKSEVLISVNPVPYAGFFLCLSKIL